MKGIYVLLIESHRDIEVEIGKIGTFEFKKGFYAYVGSGLSRLESRIGRHLRKDKKKMHWHIDYFLSRAVIEVKEVIFAEIDERKECEVAEKMKDTNALAIENFGCSDCSCKSHLFFSTDLKRLEEQIYRSFCTSELEPTVFYVATH